MKIFLLSTLTFCCNVLFAQNLVIEQKWPSPRAGEELEVSIGQKTDNGKKKIGEFNFSTATKDTGWVNVGPISMRIGDSLFTSDSISVRVIDSLPPVKNGFWFRFETINGERFLITEQRINYTTSEDRDNGKELFTVIDCYDIREAGLRLREHSSTRGPKAVNIGGEVYYIPYMMVMYKIEIDPRFDGQFVLERGFFENWPAGVNFPEIIIKK